MFALHDTDVNECFEGSVLHNCVNARCRNTNGSFECDCLPGYAKPFFGGNICEGSYNNLVIDNSDLICDCIMQILMSVQLYGHPVLTEVVAILKGVIFVTVSHHSSMLTTQMNAYVRLDNFVYT